MININKKYSYYETDTCLIIQYRENESINPIEIKIPWKSIKQTSKVRERVDNVKNSLIALADLWRDDWSTCQGKTLKSQIGDIIDVIDGKMLFEDFCLENNIPYKFVEK